MDLYNNTQNNSSATSYRKNIWIELGIFIALTFIGWISIFSIDYNEKTFSFFSNLSTWKLNYIKQLIWICVALAIAVLIIFSNSKIFSSFSYHLYAIGIVLMIITIFFGINYRGSRSWLNLGLFRVQVSQFMIIFTNMALAKFLSNRDIKRNCTNQLIAFAIISFPALLSIYQSKTGVALVFISLMTVLFIEGISLIYVLVPTYFIILIICSIAVSNLIFNIILFSLLFLIILLFIKILGRKKFIFILLIGLVGLTSVMHNKVMPLAIKKILKPYQIKRLYSTFGKRIDVDGKVVIDKSKKYLDYNVTQSIVAIGSGGITGKGFLKNTQTRLDFVPEQSTDFIICSFAESFGFLGILVLFALYFIFIIRSVSIADKQRSVYSQCYIYGAISIITFHILVNIGMAIGLLPVIGIPLPFVSYGGGSMISFSILYFIIIRLDIDRQTVIN